MDNIESLINEIINGINPKWDKLRKMRYVYLELGKRLSKDTDFFFSVDDKLSDLNLSVNEIKDIYESTSGRNGFVICRSAAYLLKRIFDRIGIESQLVRYNRSIHWEKGKDEVTIHHWFLAAKDEFHTYFMNLSSDLYNIRMGFSTEHFAEGIRYRKEVDGKWVYIYDGPRIKETVLHKEVLRSIDIELGYIKTAYNYDENSNRLKEHILQYEDASLGLLKSKANSNELYYELEMFDTPFYNDMLTIKYKDRVINFREVNMKDISDEDMLIWKKELCKRVLGKIEELVGMDLNVIPYIESKDWNYDVWLLRLCVLCERHIIKYLSNGENVNDKDLIVDVQNFQYNKWSSKIKKELKVKNSVYDYNNVLSLIDKLNTIVNAVDERNSKTFKNIYPKLAYHFIPSDRIYENNLDEDGYLINHYIANKFRKVFVNTFSCNDIRTPFNDLNYSEQIVVIKRVLEILFPEITYKNSYEMDDYNNNYSPVMNRIHVYPVKSLRTGNYSIVFNILGNNSSGDYYFFYNPRENTFKVADALEIYNDYIVISERMKDRFTVESMEYDGISM